LTPDSGRDISLVKGTVQEAGRGVEEKGGDNFGFFVLPNCKHSKDHCFGHIPLCLSWVIL